jgi:hypothetical protein
MKRPALDSMGDAADPGSCARNEDSELASLVTRRDLPSMFQRWELVLAPGSEHPTEADPWADALVLIQHGRLEVDCRAGGTRTFGAGDLLALDRLGLRVLRNPGHVPVRLVAVRRGAVHPTCGLLRVIRHIRQ